MTSQLDIWNMALALVGARSDVQDPNEDSNEAYYCRLFYPQARDTILRAHDWGFARIRTTLAKLGNVASPTLYLYRYNYPSDALALRALNDRWNWDWIPVDLRPRYEIGAEVDANGVQTRVLLTSETAANVVYTRSTTDTSLFDPAFVGVLSWALAAFLAKPLSRDDAAQQRAAVQAQAALQQAMTQDANERGGMADMVPDWLLARGGSAYGSWPYYSPNTGLLEWPQA